MSLVSLRDYQEDALKRMRNGCILNGGVGSGKSRTGLAYYYTMHGGQVNTDHYVEMKHPRDLYIITTARKRDEDEWDLELCTFLMSRNPELNRYKNKIVIDSWNNIKKYIDVKDAFFIFDEQRVVGYGVWTRSFLKITSKNKWILLSATPGDTWLDYVPVFIANGFYKNKTDFARQHIIYNPFVSYPSVKGYMNEGRLIRYRNSILVNMDFERQTLPHHETIITSYDVDAYKEVVSKRWNIYENKPIDNAGEYCFVLHRIVNSSEDRVKKLIQILTDHPKAIIFYNYDYELDILKRALDGWYPYTEWNGHKHEPILTGDKWCYLLQYTAGCEAWNCITTDTIIFYSENYSYKKMTQAAGRIDRMNTPYKNLYYFHFKSTSKIDGAMYKALARKKTFSEKGFAPMFSNDKDKTPRDDSKVVVHYESKSGPSKFEQMTGMHISDYCEEYNNWEDPSNPLYGKRLTEDPDNPLYKGDNL